jgi:hypothetical protein
MGTIILNEKQRRRCEIITRLIANKISSSEASELLGVTERQVRRIRRRYEAQGLETLVHGNQGRPSPRRRPPAFIEQLRELAGPTGRYHDSTSRIWLSCWREMRVSRSPGPHFHACSLPITFARPDVPGWRSSACGASVKVPPPNSMAGPSRVQ